MKGKEIRALLRGATRDKTLVGWYFYDRGGDRYYVVTHPDLSTQTFIKADAEDFCTDLYMSGTDFLFIGA